MTKGEFPLSSNEAETIQTGQDSLVGLPSSDGLNNDIGFNKYRIPNTDSVFSAEIDNNSKIEQVDNVFGGSSTQDDYKQTSLVSTELNNNDEQLDIAQYVQNLQSSPAKRTIHRILSKDINESDIDIENIEHYLVIAHCSHSQNTLKCCENKLISNLSSDNCESYNKIAEHYDLKQLQAAAIAVIQTNYSSQKAEVSSHNNNCSSQNPRVNITQQDCNFQSPSCQKSNTRNKSYSTVFTCGTVGSKRTVTAIVYDNKMRNKSYTDLQRGYKISKQFQCCCLQDDEDDDPYVFWCFGKSVYRYDPILNKCKARASLACKRSKFCMVACAKHCYAIGGIYKSRKVLEIEEYSCSKNKWKRVARLPRECLAIESSCVVFNDLIYIFCAILNEDGQIKECSTGVYVFNPIRHTVKPLSEIPFSFSQIKTCVLGSFIYIASDKGHFIRYSPNDGTFIKCLDQILVCKDFGMYSRDSTVVLVGGKNINGTYTNVIRTFCTVSGQWETLSATLPDCMTICGTCEVKIPSSAGSIVPFYETNICEKWRK